MLQRSNSIVVRVTASTWPRASRAWLAAAVVLAAVGCAHPDAPSGASGTTGAGGETSTAADPGDAAVETMRIAPPPDAGAQAEIAAMAGAGRAPAPADVPAAPPGPAGDDTLDPSLFACHADADCTAVRKNGCCNHGELEAVATAQVAAYKASFTCRTHVMCPQYLRRDLRVAVCDRTASRCQMAAPGGAAAAPSPSVQTTKRSP